MSFRSLSAVLPIALIFCAPAQPGSAAPGPSDPMLYVANQAAATVSVIDARTDSLVTTVDLQKLGFSAKAKPHDTAVEPDGSYWYVSLIGDNYVVKFDRDNQVVGKASMEIPGLLSLDPHSDLLFATRTMSAVHPPTRVGVIHRSTMKIDEVDVVINRPHALAVDPKGRYAYVGSLAENQIAIVDGQTEQVSLVPLPGDSLHMIVDWAFSPDGHWVVGTDQMQNEAVVLDATDPLHPRETTTVPVKAWPWHVQFTPDGREVWFGNQKANAVTVIDAKTWKVAAEITGNGLAEPHGVAVSPDGKTVFISSHNLQGAYKPEHPRPGGTGTVVVIDRAARKITKVIETDQDAVGMSVAGRP